MSPDSISFSRSETLFVSQTDIRHIYLATWNERAIMPKTVSGCPNTALQLRRLAFVTNTWSKTISFGNNPNFLCVHSDQVIGGESSCAGYDESDSHGVAAVSRWPSRESRPNEMCPVHSIT